MLFMKLAYLYHAAMVTLTPLQLATLIGNALTVIHIHGMVITEFNRDIKNSVETHFYEIWFVHL